MYLTVVAVISTSANKQMSNIQSATLFGNIKWVEPGTFVLFCILLKKSALQRIVAGGLGN